MEYKQAIEFAKSRIREFFEVGENTDVKIYDYFDGEDKTKDRPFCGVRVSEVDFVSGNSGASFMQVDVPFGLLLCSATERVIMACVEDWDAMEIADEVSILETVVQFCKK